MCKLDFSFPVYNQSEQKNKLRPWYHADMQSIMYAGNDIKYIQQD